MRKREAHRSLAPNRVMNTNPPLPLRSKSKAKTLISQPLKMKVLEPAEKLKATLKKTETTVQLLPKLSSRIVRGGENREIQELSSVSKKQQITAVKSSTSLGPVIGSKKNNAFYYVATSKAV